MFTHTLKYPSAQAPLIERGWTQESEYPWRKGISIVVRLPGTNRARAFGIWTKKGCEDDFHKAAGTSHVKVPVEEIRTW